MGKRKAPQFLDQFDHRPRIPFAIIEQLLPHAVALVLGDLVGDEEEPGDFDASLGRTRTGAVQDALPKPMACLSSNVDINVA